MVRENPSKACRQCKQSKRRCDRKLPTCGYCIKRGIECSGPLDAINVVFSANSAEQASSSSSAGQRGKYSSFPSYKNETTLSLGARYSSERARLSPEPPATRPARPANTDYDAFEDGVTTTLDMVPSMNTVYLEGVLNSFLNIYAPQSTTLCSGCQWVHEAVLKPERGLALDTAIKALSMSRLGWMTKDRRLSMLSYTVYGTALTAMQRALNDEQLMYEDSTLAAARTLLVYEYFAPASNSIRAWHGHNSGLQAILRARGPSTPQSTLARSLLADIRNGLMNHAIQTRTSSFFGERTWKTRTRRSDSNETEALLQDLGYDVAALLENMDQLEDPLRAESSNSSSSSSSKDILYDWLVSSNALDDNLQAWYLDNVQNLPSPLYTQRSAEPDSDFDFFNLPMALLTMNSWGLQLALGAAVISVCQRLFTPDSFLLLEEDLMNVYQEACARHTVTREETLASNIVRSMPYCMSEEFGLFGAMKSLFAIRTARSHLLNSKSDILIKCEEQYGALVEVKGFRFAENIADSKSEPKELIRCDILWDEPLPLDRQ